MEFDLWNSSNIRYIAVTASNRLEPGGLVFASEGNGFTFFKDFTPPLIEAAFHFRDMLRRVSAGVKVHPSVDLFILMETGESPLVISPEGARLSRVLVSAIGEITMEEVLGPGGLYTLTYGRGGEEVSRLARRAFEVHKRRN